MIKMIQLKTCLTTMFLTMLITSFPHSTTSNDDHNNSKLAHHEPRLHSTPGYCKEIYIVKKGDDLWQISETLEWTLDELIHYNQQFEDPNLIYPGDEVCISVGLTHKNDNEENGSYYNCKTTHLILAQETLTTIAEDYHTTVEYLLEINADIQDVDLIYEGDQICVDLEYHEAHHDNHHNAHKDNHHDYDHHNKGHANW